MSRDVYSPGRRVASTRFPCAASGVIRAALLLLLALITACGGNGDDPESRVRAARILPDSGASVGQALAGYAYFSNPVWETYVDGERRTMVRFVAEYDVARGTAQCPSVGAEVKPAARVFVSLVFAVQGDGAVTLAETIIEAFSATGYSAKYLADQTTAARIAAGQPCVACMALFLPASL
ncbi:hypothetical protein ASZ90_000716 [hydrocarbon metagenome]|uniref:Uncharacterized protein n=1 Tax=hydrocarbon metagenome TaxID=938273 RepID=A0A0W8G896_9ZZZZ